MSSSNFNLNLSFIRNRFPNSNLSPIPLIFHLTSIHQRVNLQARETFVYSHPTPSFRFLIDPQSVADRAVFCRRLQNFLSGNPDLQVSERIGLARTIPTILRNCQHDDLLQVNAFVEIFRTEFVNGTEVTGMVDGSYVINDVGAPRRRPPLQSNAAMIDGGYVLDAVHSSRENGVSCVKGLIEKRSFYYSEESEEECAICYEKYGKETKAVKLGCNHVFHQKCLLRWAERKNTCPLCRTMVY